MSDLAVELTSAVSTDSIASSDWNLIGYPNSLAPILSAAKRAVRRDPRSSSAQHALGMARMEAGHWDLAAAAFAAAVRIAPADADHWVGLGTARLETANIRGAEIAFRQARTLVPHHPAGSVALAALLRRSGDPFAGATVLDDALAAHPENLDLRHAKAADLLDDDRAEEAIQLLGPAPPEREPARTQWCIHRVNAEVQRNNVEAARAMIATAAPPGLTLPIMWQHVLVANASGREADARSAAAAAETRLHAPGERQEERIAAHFSLARFWAAREERARAFALWTAGHQLMARTQPFKRQEFADFADAMIARFDAERLHTGPHSGNEDPAPIFIVGMPRSGTTLTEQILAGHHAIFGAGERTALATSFARLGGAGESGAAAGRVAACSQPALQAEAVRYLHEMHALAPAAARIVDKMPGNFRLLGLVGLLFPKARIIHCVRDPRDIGFSIFSRRFMGHHAYAHDLRDLGWYIARQHRLMAHWSVSLPNPILRVHLHDWMADLPGTLARVLDFLGLDYDANCERFFELDREVRTASRAQVRRPVNRAGLGRWRAYADHLMPLIDELIAGGVLATREHLARREKNIETEEP
jgi:Flp pilus assembly protein TadD